MIQSTNPGHTQKPIALPRPLPTLYYYQSPVACRYLIVQPAPSPPQMQRGIKVPKQFFSWNQTALLYMLHQEGAAAGLLFRKHVHAPRNKIPCRGAGTDPSRPLTSVPHPIQKKKTQTHGGDILNNKKINPDIVKNIFGSLLSIPLIPDHPGFSQLGTSLTIPLLVAMATIPYQYINYSRISLVIYPIVRWDTCTH